MCVDVHDIREAIAGEGDMRYLIRPCVSRASLEPGGIPVWAVRCGSGARRSIAASACSDFACSRVILM